MKKRNKYYLRDKEYLKFEKNLKENQDAQRNLGWAELPEPEFIGYKAKLEPRDDIQNRKDSDVFWEICNKFGSVERSRTFDRSHNLSKKVRRDGVLHETPNIRYINEHTYLSLRPAVKKYFGKETFARNSFGGIKYYCNIPNFYWQITYEKEYRTKVKLFDEVLKQEESELYSILNNKFFDKRFSYNSAPKHFRKTLNRKLRYKSKSILYNIVKNEKDIEFVDNYKNCSWLWW